MELVEQYDGDASVQAVRDFFTKDDPQHPRNYWRIKRRYEAMYRLGSQWGDITGVRANGGNATESKLIEGNAYSRAMKAIKEGLDCCSAVSREVIILRYIEQQKTWQIAERIGLTGNDRYQRADRQACYEFADVMDVIIPRYDVEELIPFFLQKGTKQEGNRNDLGTQ